MINRQRRVFYRIWGKIFQNQGGRKSMTNFESPLSGKILELNLKVGQQVNEDDEVIVIEAMKMENPIYCPLSGTVKEIRVQVGDQVNEGEVLAVID